MIQKCILFICLTFSLTLFSQNLIKNGSFTKKKGTVTWMEHDISICKYWDGKNGGSPDYYSNEYLAHTDDSLFYKGTSFIGLATYIKREKFSREFINQKIRKLKKNRIYISNFYIRNEQSIDTDLLRNSQSIVSNMCYIYLGKNKSKIDNWTSHYLIDSLLNWTAVNGFYKAIGDEVIIRVGNFEDQKTVCFVEKHDKNENMCTYYLFDNIYLTELRPSMIDTTEQFFETHHIDKKLDCIYESILIMKNRPYLLLELKIKESDSITSKIRQYAILNKVSEERILFMGSGKNQLKNILYKEGKISPFINYIENFNLEEWNGIIRFLKKQNDLEMQIQP